MLSPDAQARSNSNRTIGVPSKVPQSVQQKDQREQGIIALGAAQLRTPATHIFGCNHRSRRSDPRPAAHLLKYIIAALLISLFVASQANAQDWPSDWGVDLDIPAPLPPDNTQQAPANTGPNTPQNNPVAPQPGETDDTPGTLMLQAILIEDGQRIANGLIWRVYQETGLQEAPSRLISTHKQSTPVLTLKPGNYAVNVAFGRANLTKRIALAAGQQITEQFILNAGGLKLEALIGNRPPDTNSVMYQILEGEPDQSGQRAIVVPDARPGLIIRLNAGIYHIISRYGDANATINTDVTVEAGKLTVAKLSHTAATVTFKLVARPGGEALPQTRWTVETKDGKLVKKSVGALPTHILAPGQYVVTAQNAEHIFKSEFQVEDGQIASVEVVAQ